MKKIVMLAGKGFSSNAVFNALENKFGVHTVILEDKETAKQFLFRRVRKLGILKVVGQVVFLLIGIRMIRFFSKNRTAEIIRNYAICGKEINKSKLKRVTSINSQEVIDLLKSVNPDIVVINGTRIISKDVLNCSNCKFLNIHAGVTPKYRGVHGAYWALVNNDRENCGVTVYIVNSGIDTGDVLYQESIEVTDRDSFATYPLLQLAKGIELLVRAINDVFADKILVRNVTRESKLWYHPTISEYISNLIIKKTK